MPRNNEDRIGPGPEEGGSFIPPAPQFSFTVPTEMVDLPSKGRRYPDGHPWKDKESVEIRYMTAKEEEILNNKAYIRKGTVLDRLCESILVEPVDVSTIYNGDKNAILHAARISAFGAKYKAPIICPDCLSVKSFEFDLTKVSIYSADDASFNADGTFDIELPVSKMTVRCKLLTGKEDTESMKLHQAKISMIEKTIRDPVAQKKAKDEIESVSRIDSYKQFTVSVNNNTDRKYINAFYESILAKDSKYLREQYKVHCPDIDLSYDFECPSCESTSKVQIPITKDFFWGD